MSFVYKCNCDEVRKRSSRWMETIVDKDKNCIYCDHVAVSFPKYVHPRGKSVGGYQPMAGKASLCRKGYTSEQATIVRGNYFCPGVTIYE